MRFCNQMVAKLNNGGRSVFYDKSSLNTAVFYSYEFSCVIQIESHTPLPFSSSQFHYFTIFFALISQIIIKDYHQKFNSKKYCMLTRKAKKEEKVSNYKDCCYAWPHYSMLLVFKLRYLILRPFIKLCSRSKK